MSPKQITKLAITVAVISVLGSLLMLVAQPNWGVWNWWPAMGLGLSLLLFVASFLKGAYVASQQRVALIDKLNDCYTGTPATESD